MKKNDISELELLARHCDSSGHFITCIMSLKHITTAQLSERLQTSQEYVDMVKLDQVTSGIKASVALARALEVDVIPFCKIIYEYKLKEFLKQDGSCKSLQHGMEPDR